MNMKAKSISYTKELLQLRIELGIQKGLDDVDAGRYFEASSKNLAAMKERITSRT